MKKKLLLIVPHQDDELFAGGGILTKASTDPSIEAYVLFITNGDFYPGEVEHRLQESLETLVNCFHLAERNIIFLGYGDTWKGNKHIYNAPNQCGLESVAGHTMTYALQNHPEYRYLKSGKHSVYCRAELKNDLKDAIIDIRADILICVDYDPHPDHRAVSLLFEECMGEILRENMEYRPAVLKTFAYDGMWKGEADFFVLPHRKTQIAQMHNPTLRIEDGIRIPVPRECNTVYLKDNILYQASKRYKTQSAWQKADRFINADMIFWKRNTCNLLYQADLTASTGTVRYVADFKTFDCKDVLDGEVLADDCAWIPVHEDRHKSIIIHFDMPVAVSVINIYALNNKSGILNSRFVFDNGYVLSTGELNATGKVNHFVFETQDGIKEIRYQLDEYYGVAPGITEIEVLEKAEDIDDILCLFPEVYSTTICARDRFFIQIEKGIFQIKKFLSICFPNGYFMRKYYPALNEKRYYRGFYHVSYLVSHLVQRFKALK